MSFRVAGVELHGLPHVTFRVIGPAGLKLDLCQLTKNQRAAR